MDLHHFIYEIRVNLTLVHTGSHVKRSHTLHNVSEITYSRKQFYTIYIIHLIIILHLCFIYFSKRLIFNEIKKTDY
jgi:hypothetical protein